VGVSRVKVAEQLLQQGKAAEALADIQTNLRAYGEDELPQARMLSGTAHNALAQQAGDDAARRAELVAAGLDFMRVFAYWPKSEFGGEALLAAGRVNATLGNANAGAAAFQRVIAQYPQSPWAAQAKTDLSALQKGDGK
jgi:TolA-binding protein